ncbi:hypothetical protein ACFQJ7_00070 [Halovenus rubra]|uniref:Uncharacterized protein n=2 Tax=Halovenus rubra TaxID=869890 RepID=A0ACC7E1L0_9EURY|nr:hypothetical protein [Halovenus rubra]
MAIKHPFSHTYSRYCEWVEFVESKEFEDWIEAFLSPTNPTGARFQLVEYHDNSGTQRPSATDLSVDGTRLTDG